MQRAKQQEQREGREDEGEVCFTIGHFAMIVYYTFYILHSSSFNDVFLPVDDEEAASKVSLNLSSTEIIT